MEIGEPRRIYTVEPLDDPVPGEEPPVEPREPREPSEPDPVPAT